MLFAILQENLFEPVHCGFTDIKTLFRVWPKDLHLIAAEANQKVERAVSRSPNQGEVRMKASAESRASVRGKRMAR